MSTQIIQWHAAQRVTRKAYFVEADGTVVVRRLDLRIHETPVNAHTLPFVTSGRLPV